MLDAKSREIFQYHDGDSSRFGDPMLIEERWHDACADQDMVALEEKLKSPIREVRADANRLFLAMIRGAFEVQELDGKTGKGLTVEETFDLSARFWAWSDGLKKNTEPTPGSSPNSDAGLATTEADSSRNTASG